MTGEEERRLRLAAVSLMLGEYRRNSRDHREACRRAQEVRSRIHEERKAERRLQRFAECHGEGAARLEAIIRRARRIA